MKLLLPILCWWLPTIVLSQVKDSLLTNSINSNSSAPSLPNNKTYKPEIFTSGFIDIINSGQVNASARFIRLYIGEPGKLSIPLSLYSGVSSNNFQNLQSGISQRSNDGLVANYINPLSGLANVSVDGIVFFNKKSPQVTKAGWLYHFGERILTGYKTGLITDPQTGNPVNFLNSFATTGLYFQTGAWERTNAKNVGVFWIAFRYIGCYTNPQQVKEFLPDIQTNGFYAGYSLAFGVDINNLVNLKVIYYKYTKQPEIDYSLPIYQFSFNYSLKN